MLNNCTFNSASSFSTNFTVTCGGGLISVGGGGRCFDNDVSVTSNFITESSRNGTTGWRIRCTSNNNVGGGGTANQVYAMCCDT